MGVCSRCGGHFAQLRWYQGAGIRRPEGNRCPVNFHAHHPCPGPYNDQSDFCWSISIPTSAPAPNFVSYPGLTSVAGQFSYLLLLLPFLCFYFVSCPNLTLAGKCSSMSIEAKQDFHFSCFDLLYFLLCPNSKSSSSFVKNWVPIQSLFQSSDFLKSNACCSQYPYSLKGSHQ